MHRSTFLPLAGTVLLLLAESAAGQLALNDTAPKNGGTTAAGVRVVHSGPVGAAVPVVDGGLDDPAWATVEPAVDFVKMRPDPGKPASERTEARVLYGEDAVYVALRMYDHPDSIAAQLARRDASGSYSDWAHVLIDSYHDRRTGFRFSVSPRGVQKDVLHFDDSSEDANWDAVWESAARVDSLGWTAELRIPLSQLRFSGESGERVWGVNFGRDIARRGELAWWSPVLPTAGGIVSQSGELHGLSGIRPARRLEVLPYSVGSVTRAPGDAANPFYRASDGGLALGADLRYGLTSDLTLSATLNPDFGQVEADPSVVNLSAYESYFPEKRPFFMEGANIFSFGVGTDNGSGEQLFYSRRIGRAPQRGVHVPGGWVDRPELTTILGAAKVSGKTGGWTVGLLSALTSEEEARVAVPGSAVSTETVEPLANYGVLSLSRDFREGRSTLGILGTSTHRRLDGREELAFLRDAAYSGGIMGRHRFLDDTWEASAYLAGSHIQGSEEAIARVQTAPGRRFQRPDAEHVELDPTRTSLSGAVGSFWVGKNGGSSLRGGLGGHLRTPGLELNDLGFQTDADVVQLFGNLHWNQFRPMGVFRSWTVGINPFSHWTTGGERSFTQIGHWTNFELQNLWNGGWWVGKRFEALSTEATRGGPAITRPGGTNFSAWLNTDRREPVSFHPNVWGGWESESGSWNYGIGAGVSFRPSAQLNVQLRPSLSRNHNGWQYVAQTDGLGERRYLFGELDQTTVSLTTRLNYTISPTLSLELYAQPFVSAGDYGSFREVADPRAASFGDRFHTFGGELAYDAEKGRYQVDRDGDGRADYGFGDPEFNFKQMRSNAVLRWEYRPGSTLFVVWSQGRSDYLRDGSFGLGRDFGRLMGMDDDHSVPATNVLMVKASYWLSF